MRDLEEQLQVLGRAMDAQTSAVTADEARRLAEQGGTRTRLGTTSLRWPLAAAAVVLLVLGTVTVAMRGDDDEDVITAQPGGYALDLDGHRDWLVALLNAEAEADDAVLSARFAPEFLESVPPDEVRALGASVGPGGPWTVSTEVERRADVLVAQLVGAQGAKLRLTLRLDDSRRIEAATVLATRECGTLVPADAAAIAADPQLAWAFDLVSSDRAVPDEELDDHLSATFLSAMTPDQFRRGLDEVRAIGPFVPRWFESPDAAGRTVVLVGTFAGEEGQLVVEVDAEGRVEVLNLTTQSPCALP